MRRVYLAALLATSACGTEPVAVNERVAEAPQPEFRELPGQNRFVMILPDEADPGRWKLVAKDKCGAVDFCQIFAWTDAVEAPQTFPMTDREVETMAFSYSVNRNSGHEQALWDCDRFARDRADECG